MGALLERDLRAASTLNPLAPKPPHMPDKAKAKSVIFLFLAGGPSHIDSFDPKPLLGDSSLTGLAVALDGKGDRHRATLSGQLGLNDYQLLLHPLSTRFSDDFKKLTAEQLAQDGVEEQHGLGAERPVRAAGLQEVDGGARQAAEADLARDRLDEGLAAGVERLERQAHARPSSLGRFRYGALAPAGRPGPTGVQPWVSMSGRDGAGSPSERAWANAS